MTGRLRVWAEGGSGLEGGGIEWRVVTGWEGKGRVVHPKSQVELYRSLVYGSLLHDIQALVWCVGAFCSVPLALGWVL